MGLPRARWANGNAKNVTLDAHDLERGYDGNLALSSNSNPTTTPAF